MWARFNVFDAAIDSPLKKKKEGVLRWKREVGREWSAACKLTIEVRIQRSSRSTICFVLTRWGPPLSTGLLLLWSVVVSSCFHCLSLHSVPPFLSCFTTLLLKMACVCGCVCVCSMRYAPLFGRELAAVRKRYTALPRSHSPLPNTLTSQQKWSRVQARKRAIQLFVQRGEEGGGGH